MIRVAIIDDHAIVRAGLRQYFSEQVDLTVVAEASSGREAIDIVRKGDVDVIVMDLSMPDQSGVDALAAIKARAPDLPVLILSGFPEEHYATTLLRQGASGYLNKECDPEEIVRAIRTVFRGRKYITAGVAELLAERLERRRSLLVRAFADHEHRHCRHCGERERKRAAPQQRKQLQRHRHRGDLKLS